MRLAPDEVRRLLNGDVSPAALSVTLVAVQRDPNWRVTETAGVAMRTLSLLYGPSGDLLDVVLLRVGASWRGRVQPPPSAVAA